MQRETLHEQHKPTTASAEKLAYRNTKIDVGALESRRRRTASSSALRGVDHTARPTWKLRETVTFYRDVLGLPLIHTISARRWEPRGSRRLPAFLFSMPVTAQRSRFSITSGPSGRRSTSLSNIRFSTATHTAWAVDTMDEL